MRLPLVVARSPDRATAPTAGLLFVVLPLRETFGQSGWPGPETRPQRRQTKPQRRDHITMKNFTYYRPATAEAAVALLEANWGNTELLGGGTDLHALQKDYI